jgi:hypothetical protein
MPNAIEFGLETQPRQANNLNSKQHGNGTVSIAQACQRRKSDTVGPFHFCVVLISSLVPSPLLRPDRGLAKPCFPTFRIEYSCEADRLVLEPSETCCLLHQDDASATQPNKALHFPSGLERVFVNNLTLLLDACKLRNQ